MTSLRLPDYIDHMLEAAEQAMIYVEGMRNRIAHGYYDINLDTVWETIQTALPELKTQLLAIKSKL
jgi:uncharacterized protein with HEPN domain